MIQPQYQQIIITDMAHPTVLPVNASRRMLAWFPSQANERRTGSGLLGKATMPPKETIHVHKAEGPPAKYDCPRNV
jgi:hypothetical protein